MVLENTVGKGIGNPAIPFGHRMPKLSKDHLKREKIGYFYLTVGEGHPLYFSAETIPSSSAIIPPKTKVLLRPIDPGRPSRFARSIATTVFRLDLKDTDPQYIVKIPIEGGEPKTGVRLIGPLDEQVFVGRKVYAPAYWFMGKRERIEEEPVQPRLKLAGKLK